MTSVFLSGSSALSFKKLNNERTLGLMLDVFFFFKPLAIFEPLQGSISIKKTCREKKE